jgi:hypothetical protein
VAIALVQKDGDIYNKEFMEKLTLTMTPLLNGVDRPPSSRFSRPRASSR